MVQTRQIAHRIPVYSYPNPHLHSFCIGLYVKAGPLYEQDAQNGLSHFWEHVIFRSIARRYDGQLYRLLDRLGLHFSACTYKELVQFTITGSPQHFATAAEILSCIFAPLEVTGQDIALERQRIKAEIREEDEKTSLGYFTQQVVCADTPLKNTIPGWPSILDKIGITALRQAHRELLSAEPCFFCLTGCVDDTHMDILAAAVERFSTTPPLELPPDKRFFPPVRDNVAPVPPAFMQRNCQVAIKNSSDCLVRFTFDIAADRYTAAELDLLFDILFSGDSCKMYQQLSEQSGCIYSHQASLERYRNIGWMAVQFEVAPAKLYQAVDRTMGIFMEMRAGLTDQLETATAPYLQNAPMLLDAPEDLNWVLGYEGHILDLPYGHQFLTERSAAYAAVTPERMTEISREIFVPDNLTVTLKANRRKFSQENIRNRILAIYQ